MVLILGACGRGSEVVNENENYNGTAGYTAESGTSQGEQPIRNLSILAAYCDWFIHQDFTITQLLRAAEREMQQEWRHRDETLYIDVELVRFSDWQAMESRNQRLNIQMMAGDAPDIIIINGQNVRPMAERGFLVNFYDLID